MIGAYGMNEQTQKAILSAAASSAMEGLPLDEENIKTVERILNGELTLQEYYENLRHKYQVI